MSKVRVAVIGLGMGKSHLKNYKANANVEIAAVCDMNKELADTIAKEYGVANIYTDANEMLAKEKLDAVSVVTPNKFHSPLTLAAVDKGLHVLCEKPMAMNTAEAVEMKMAADKKGVNLMINFSYRFSAMSYALKKTIDSGIIGPIYFGRSVWHRRLGMPRFGGWFGQKALSGGGPLIDLGVHRLDLALWLMGYPAPVSVNGSAYNKIAAQHAAKEGKPFDVEDCACGLIKFDNGATLILEASWALHIKEKEHMITSLYGEKGGIVQKNTDGGYNFTAEIYTNEDGMEFTKTLDQSRIPVPTPQDEFVASIIEKRKPMADGEDGIKVMKILDGIYESARTGKEVRY